MAKYHAPVVEKEFWKLNALTLAYKTESLLEAADDDSVCLKLDKKSGYVLLKKDNPYYYQLQAQLAMTNKQYCTFVLFKSESESELHIERIFPTGLFFLYYVVQDISLAESVMDTVTMKLT